MALHMSRLLFNLMLTIGQVIGLTFAHPVQAKTPEPVVHVILFWMDGCPSCEIVMQQVLPQLQSHYGGGLEVSLVEIISSTDVDNLYQVGESYGLTKEQVKVPLLVIGNEVLVGSDQIPGSLPDLVDRYLSTGGVDYPDLENRPGSAKVAQSALAEEPQSNGMLLAAIIGIFMLVALVYTAWWIMRALGDHPMSLAPRWLDLAIPILSVMGLGVAIYLLYVEATSSQAFCGPVGDCNAVQKSPYAKVFGLIPVGLVGFAGYVTILVTWFWGRFRADRLAGYVPIVLWGMAIFGTLYSVYLTYLELFVIKAVCIWCLSSAVIITLIMVASLPGATQWLAGAEEEP